MGLSEEINKSAEELNAVRAAIDLKKKEFAALQAAEQTVRVLRQQTDDLIKQKNELEEELRIIRHRHQAAQEEAERDFIERDMMLKKKEFEWSQLIQELDQFLSKLAGRFHSHPVAHRLPKEESTATTEVSQSGIPLSEYICDETGRPPGDNEPDLIRGEPLMWDSIWGEKDFSFDEKNYILGQSSVESSRPFHAIHRDGYIEQNGRVEDSDSSAKKDNVPLKFAPKNSSNNI
jgi:phosphoenolpyruvate synthase/pyruvate phosphate dikinase